MQYKTIILELLEARPRLHDRLRQERQLLTTLDSLAQELKIRYEVWKANLAAKPEIDPGQIPNAAMEMALQEIETRLPPESPSEGEESLSLSDAVSFIRRTTPTD